MRITVELNGRAREGEVEPRTLLSDFIRHQAGLTGTHVGCEHGVCGACTVHLDGVSVRACCLLAVQAPQTPCSQPTCVPVSPRRWRRKSVSSSRGSTSSTTSRPFTVSLISVMRSAPRRARRRARRASP